MPTYEQSFASHEKAEFWHPTMNGDLMPCDLKKHCNKKHWFKCCECGHDFASTPGHIVCGTWCPYCAHQKLCDDINCQLCFNKSFASHEKSQFWHPTKNHPLVPRDVFKKAGKKHWFKCSECGHDFDNSPSTVVNGGNWCPYCTHQKLCNDDDCQLCFSKSFASHEKSPFWHLTKNEQMLPRHVFKRSDKKCWFKCSECDHDFISILGSIVRNGTWCPYCVNQKLCDDINCKHCLNMSFASHEKAIFWHPTKNNQLQPRDVFKQSNKKYWFKCDECHHDFDSKLSNIVCNGHWCPYCIKPSHKLCDDNNCHFCFNNSFASHKRANFWHPTKNGTLVPRDVFKNTGKKYWFKCGVCNHDFDSSLDNVVGKGRWCPTCVLKTEKKFKNYLTNNKGVLYYIKFIHKFRPEWADLRETHGTFYEYDFYIEFENDLKIIVEIDGAQHYKQVSNWASPLHNQIRDYIKEKLATNEEINIIRLKQEDVLNDKNDWQNIFERFVTRKKANNKVIEIIQGYKT